jgi:hypothetical protein
MDKERTVKRITEWGTIVGRMTGRPRLRWEGDVERMWGKRRFRFGVRWLWMEKHGRGLLGRSKLTKSCSVKRGIYIVD